MDDDTVVSQNQSKNQNMTDTIIKIVAACLFIITLVLVTLNIQVTYDVQNIVSHQPHQVLPKQFAITTAGYVRDQARRGTCWDFATMRFLEERYRVQGAKLGLLKLNQYLRFSEQAHGTNIINFCKQHPEKCPDTPGAKGIASDGYPSWIYHFQEYLNEKLTVDLNSCPYFQTESPETDGKCDGMNEFIQTKRLKYSVKNYRYLLSKQDIKEAIVNKNSSFPLITEMMRMEYFVPCDQSSHYNKTNQCIEKQRRCPTDMQNFLHNRFCGVTSLTTSSEGEFIARRYRRDPAIGAHAMLLVGYNDEYKMVGQNPGGFIVQNSWGPTGHSLDYMLGKISRREEDQICPGVDTPSNWVPIDFEGEDKYKLRKPTVLSYSKSSKFDYIEVDNKIVSDALALEPKMKDGDYYVIKYIEANVDQTVLVTMGITQSSNPDQNFSQIDSFVELPPMPIDMLNRYFSPVNVIGAENYMDCGYYFIPYDFVDMTHQVSGLWWVDVMDIEFTRESFIRNNNKPGSKELDEATFEQVNRSVSSPTPWLADEKLIPRFK